jgi:dipeptidase E
MGLVPFQINPHYLDAEPSSRHMGETREDRLREYLEENELPVVGLREGGWLRREGGSLRLEGASARILRRAAAPEEAPPGSDLSALLG